MSITQVMRWGWSIFLCCLIFLNFNIQEAKAEINLHLPSVQPVNINTDFISDSVEDVKDGLDYLVKSGVAESAIESVSDGFISGFGQVGGSIAGATAACYATNVLVLPVAPPVAAAMATYCPYIGGVAGSFGGTIAGKTAMEHVAHLPRTIANVGKTAGKHTARLSGNFLKVLTPNKNHKLIPALF